MLANNGCRSCLKPFSRKCDLVRHQKNNCRAITPGTASGSNSLGSTADITIVNNNTVNNTVNNNVIINVNGHELIGISIEKFIKMELAKGTHRALLKVMRETDSDIDDLQDEFDRRVESHSRSKSADHSRVCCIASSGDVGECCILANRLTARECDDIISDLVLRSDDKIYTTHTPRLGALTNFNLELNVIHQAHLFKREAVARLVDRSRVRDMIHTHIANQDISDTYGVHAIGEDYVPWIDRNRYLANLDSVYRKVESVGLRHNRSVASAASRRKRGVF